MALPELAESEPSEDAYKESEKLWNIESELYAKLEKLEFTSPIEYVYNPLKYATDLHKAFIKKYFEKSTKKILFLGMNPGPWGMCQNGIPFGDRDHVKDWLKIRAGVVGKPNKEHPKRKIAGLNCHRREGSGRKFWDLFKLLCGSPENFFKHSFVYNLCPLAFMDEAGRNITPYAMKSSTEKKKLHEFCEDALFKIIEEFHIEKVIAIGCDTQGTTKAVLKQHKITDIDVVWIPHPSSISPKYRKGWKLKVYTILQENGLISYFSENENIDVNLLSD